LKVSDDEYIKLDTMQQCDWKHGNYSGEPYIILKYINNAIIEQLVNNIRSCKIDVVPIYRLYNYDECLEIYNYCILCENKYHGNTNLEECIYCKQLLCPNLCNTNRLCNVCCKVCHKINELVCPCNNKYIFYKCWLLSKHQLLSSLPFDLIYLILKIKFFHKFLILDVIYYIQ
jgi:hypothetical protein